MLIANSKAKQLQGLVSLFFPLAITNRRDMSYHLDATAENSAGSSKKRKTTSRDDGDGDGDDEKKMEKFYDLIRRFREARERFSDNQRKKTRKVEGEEVRTVSFQMEDFMGDAERLKMKVKPPATDTSRSRDDHESQKKDLDLRLSL